MKKIILSCSIVLSLILACGGSSNSSDDDFPKTNGTQNGSLSILDFRMENPGKKSPEAGEIIKFKHRQAETKERNYEIGINYPKNMICWLIESGFECTVTDTEEAAVTAFVRDPDKKVETRTADFTFNKK